MNAAGYCVAHDPERPDGMRELGKRSAAARRRGPAAKLPEPEREGLRQLLRGLDPQTVVAAVEQCLSGNNESARISAVKLLADLETFRAEEKEERDHAGELAAARERFEQLLRNRIRAHHQAGESKLAQELTAAARELWADGETPTGVLIGDVSTSDARAVLEGLAEHGLIRPPQSARERDELAQRDAEIARLKTQLSEFTVVA